MKDFLTGVFCLGACMGRHIQQPMFSFSAEEPVPKVQCAGFRTLETCLALAEQKLNKGASANTDLFKKMDITPSKSVDENEACL